MVHANGREVFLKQIRFLLLPPEEVLLEKVWVFGDVPTGLSALLCRLFMCDLGKEHSLLGLRSLHKKV